MRSPACELAEAAERDDTRLHEPAKADAKLVDGYCADCDKTVMPIGVEYAYGEPEHYDGISEWRCPTPGCNRREGRWTGARLTDGASEPRFGEERDEVIAEEQDRKPWGSQPR